MTDTPMTGTTDTQPETGAEPAGKLTINERPRIPATPRSSQAKLLSC